MQTDNSQDLKKNNNPILLLCMLSAHSKMQKRLTDLVLESFGTQSYKKAMDCLRVLREESIKVFIVRNSNVTIAVFPSIRF